MDWITSPEAWVALATLTALEIVLGIDNVVFISILAGKLPAAQRPRARRLGLGLAMLMRIALLFAINGITRLTRPLFSVFGTDISGRALILIAGGAFLIAKSTREIHDKFEGPEKGTAAAVRASFGGVIVQILLLDLVFSLDSVITAVGMAKHIGVMVTAVVLAVGFMMVYAKAVGEFVERHPTMKMLALSFLLMIGMALVADGLGLYIPKGYIYFAMGFSVFVEMLNLKLHKRARA